MDLGKHKNWDAAQRKFEKIVKARPQLFEARFYLANIYVMRHNYEKAIEEYEKLLPIFPNNEGILVNLAVCYEKKGEYNTSRHYAEKALEMNSKSMQALEIIRNLENKLSD